MKYELPSTELIVIEENNYLKFGEYLNDMQCDDTANKLSLDDLEYVKKLQQENKILRENANHNDKVVDKVNWENQLLKKQLEEYKKKLMIVTKMEIKEIDKNTFVGIDYFQDKCIIYENQQQEFIKYLEDEIKRINPKELDIGELNLRLNDIKFTQYLIYKEILQKYRSIIGVIK